MIQFSCNSGVRKTDCLFLLESFLGSLAGVVSLFNSVHTGEGIVHNQRKLVYRSQGTATVVTCSRSEVYFYVGGGGPACVMCILPWKLRQNLPVPLGARIELGLTDSMPDLYALPAPSWSPGEGLCVPRGVDLATRVNGFAGGAQERQARRGRRGKRAEERLKLCSLPFPTKGRGAFASHLGKPQFPPCSPSLCGCAMHLWHWCAGPCPRSLLLFLSLEPNLLGTGTLLSPATYTHVWGQVSCCQSLLWVLVPIQRASLPVEGPDSALWTPVKGPQPQNDWVNTSPCSLQMKSWSRPPCL
jgi:hypothetical protein